MTHADDNGLICPPMLAPYQVVIIPFDHKDFDKEELQKICFEIQESLTKKRFNNIPIRVHIDQRPKTVSEKKWSWIKKGVPIRLEIGLQEKINKSACMILRTNLSEKHSPSLTTLGETIPEKLQQIQNALYQKAQVRLSSQHCPLLKNLNEIDAHFSKKTPGPALIYWQDNDYEENILQKNYKVSLRCYPESTQFSYPESGPCLHDYRKTGKLTLIAKAY